MELRFKEISEWVYDTTGIEIPKEMIRFEVYENIRGGMSALGRMAYRGPLQPGGDLPRLKLDLTIDEILVLEPEIRKVYHPYSDGPNEGIQILSYCFEEVFAEKIRALAERERPRDLYDVVQMSRHKKLRARQKVIFNILEKKCAYKKIPVPFMNTLKNRPEREELEAEWKNMLAHQMSSLPDFELFWKEISGVMEWLHKGTANEEKEK